MTKKKLYLLLALVGLAAGSFLSTILTFISPLPVAYAYRKVDRKYGFLVVLLSAALLLAAGGYVTAGAFILVTGITGTIIGYQITSPSRLKIQTVIYRTLLYTSLAYGFLFFTLYASMNDKYISEINTRIDSQIDMVYTNISTDSSIMGLTGKSYTGKEAIKKYLKNNFVSFAVIVLVVLVVINVFFIAGFFPEQMDRRELFMWKVPGWFVWVPITSGFLLFMSTEIVSIIAENLFRIGLVPYFFQGVAIAAYYLNRRKMPGFISIMLIVVLSIFLVIPSTVVGFIDYWLNFRSPRRIQGV